MLPSQQHVFSHQHQFGHEPSWMHQQQSHHQQQHPSHMQHHNPQAQVQAAAAAVAVAQRDHYNRIAASNNTNGHTPHNGAHSIGSDIASSSTLAESSFSEEHRRLVNWVAELLNGNSREQALMELSKKREQVPELALIIWYSFGK
jgi:CCR4-NOT transcription complex subunit 9